MRRHALGPRLTPQRRAPRCAKLRRGAPHMRLATELATPGAMAHHAAPWLSRSAGTRAGRTTDPVGHGWPDPLHMRQEPPAQTRHAPAPVQVAKTGGRQRTSWSGLPGPSRRAASAGHASNSARRRSPMPAAGEAIVLLRCCILLLYQSRELWAQDFEFICLSWVELRGFEPLTSCMPWGTLTFSDATYWSRTARAARCGSPTPGATVKPRSR
jgi:hypothetical protein